MSIEIDRSRKPWGMSHGPAPGAAVDHEGLPTRSSTSSETATTPPVIRTDDASSWFDPTRRPLRKTRTVSRVPANTSETRLTSNGQTVMVDIERVIQESEPAGGYGEFSSPHEQFLSDTTFSVKELHLGSVDNNNGFLPHSFASPLEQPCLETLSSSRSTIDGDNIQQSSCSFVVEGQHQLSSKQLSDSTTTASQATPFEPSFSPSNRERSCSYSPRFNSGIEASRSELDKTRINSNNNNHSSGDLNNSISPILSHTDSNPPHRRNNTTSEPTSSVPPTSTNTTTTVLLPSHLFDDSNDNSTEDKLSSYNMGYNSTPAIHQQIHHHHPVSLVVNSSREEEEEEVTSIMEQQRGPRTSSMGSDPEGQGERGGGGGSCSLNEGKRRDAGDYEDDETVTVQSFDSVTVSSPAMAPVPAPNVRLEHSSNTMAGSGPPVAVAVETPSTVSTAEETDDASLGDLYSLDRSFARAATDVSFLDGSPSVSSSARPSQPHHHRVPSWEESPHAAHYYTGFEDVQPLSLASHPSASPPPFASGSTTPWGAQQRMTSFRNQTHSSSFGAESANRYASNNEPTSWLQQVQQQQQQPYQHSSFSPPPVPFLPGRGTPPIDNRMQHRSPPHQHPQHPQQHAHGGGFHPYTLQQHAHHAQQYPHPQLLQHPQQQQQQRKPTMYGPQQQLQHQQVPPPHAAMMSQHANATPPRRAPRMPPPPSPHRTGHSGPGSSLSGPSGATSGSSGGGGGGATPRSASEVLKTLLRKKACLYEPDTSRAVALVTWLVGRELALEHGYFSRQQLQAGVHTCVADKIEAGVITRTKVNRCMQIILNSCFHYIIPRPDGTEENGDPFRATFASEVEEDSYLLQVLPEPWNNIAVNREEVLKAAEVADLETKMGSSTTGKKGSEFTTPQSSPRLSSVTPDKGSPGGRDSLDGEDGTKRAVLLCFNENVRRAEDVFRCHNEFIRDTAHGSHLQLSSQEWRLFFGHEAASAPYLWGNIGIPVPYTEVHGSSHLDALGMMTSDESGKFRTSWCTKRYDHDHELCGFAHAEINGGWLRRNPLGYQYKDEMCPFVSNITDKHSGQSLFVINECPLGNTCEFAHSSEEMMYHPRRYKMRACPSAGRPGGCSLGDVCPNFHPIDTYRFPKKSDGRSARHSKYSHQSGGSKGGASVTPSGAPILMANPAPVSSFEEHLFLPGLRNLYRRQCSVVRAHLRQRGCTCHYSYFGDDALVSANVTLPVQERGLPARS